MQRGVGSGASRWRGEEDTGVIIRHVAFHIYTYFTVCFVEDKIHLSSVKLRLD